MTKNKKQVESFLFSVAGVAVMFVILVAMYVISGVAKLRFDLTEENLYTLSDGTRAILAKLDTPMEVRFYCTQDSKEMPVMLQTYAQGVEDLLDEYRKASKGKVEIRKLDPKPDSDAEESAQLDGVEGQMVNLGEKIYLGLAISQLDAKAAIPFLSPERAKLLEYDLSRAISRVATPQKPVVGVMSALQVFGEFNPMAMRMGQMQRQEPWVFISELKHDFEVKQVEMTVDEIPADVQVLMVVHPKAITDKAQYAIDQFVLRGGKLLAFLDPLSFIDSRSNPQMNPMQSAGAPGSSLDKLLKAWGLEMDGNKVVADMNFVTRINRGNRPEAAPAVLSMTHEGLDTNDVATAQVDNALIPFAGAFTGTPVEGLKQTVLIRSSKNSQLIEKFMAEFAGEQTAKDFSPSGKEFPIAVRLTGKFKTAFPDGKPTEAAPDDKAEAPKETASTAPALKESATESGVVILVADADMLHDQFSVQIQEIPGFQRIVIPRNGNLNLVQNMVDQVAGDSNLIAVRSRATMNRPFTLVRKLQAQAEDRFRTKIKDIERELQETQTRVNELQKTKETGQRFILSPEQQAELQNFRQKEAQAKRDLKQVRKDLRREIDSLENRLKWLNIAGVPFLVALSGISLALVKRKKTAAK
jgi:ABC-type uncharacterized transport system involved in gliding motility auxiliary subunit